MSDPRDTFEGLQGELDALLERLARCMQDQGQEEMAGNHVASRADAARAIYCYALSSDIYSEPRGLRASASLANHMAAVQFERRMDAWCATDGPRKGMLLAALEALEDWPAFAPLPLHPHHMEALMMAAGSLSEGSSEFFGQGAGLELTPKRAVDRRKPDRRLAALMVEMANRADPKANPIGAGLFERIGERCGMSGSTVRDAYYSPEGKHWRAMLRPVTENR